PEAGGSEVHAARIAERWAAAGIDVVLSVSRAPGAPRAGDAGGYRVVRRAGRYMVFPASVAGGVARRVGRRPGRPDGVVEIWNGMPFASPLWAPHPRVVFLHHVHGGMWDLVLPPALAHLGKFVERRVAPPLYRGTPVVTLSESSKRQIVGALGFDASRVTVVPPGVDSRFRPGGRKEAAPLVVAVGRLVPYKRFDLLIDVLARLRWRHPRMRAVIAGEGSERPALEAVAAHHHAGGWMTLPGRIGDDDLADLYRRAWLVMSTSGYEGWGMTITEAAACGTPAVASPIAGHTDAIVDGATGVLAEPGAAMVEAADALLRDEVLRRRLAANAARRAACLSWDRAAAETLRVLARDTASVRRLHGGATRG
ncbi:MAG: glycosyltransferase family 4 protein, partial [Acidimicrobiales bacterium]